MYRFLFIILLLLNTPLTIFPVSAQSSFDLCALAYASGGACLALSDEDQATDDWQQTFTNTALATLNNGTQATITNITPNQLPAGSTANILLTAPNANFNSSSQLNLTGGITVLSITPMSATQLLAEISIPATINTGFYDANITTQWSNTQQVTEGKGLLHIIATSGEPKIVSVAPHAWEKNTPNAQVTIFGQNTQFTDNAIVQFGNVTDTGITLQNVTAQSATELVVDFSISDTAREGFYDVTVTDNGLTAKDTVVGPLQIYAKLAIPKITAISPREVVQGAHNVALTVKTENTQLGSNTEVQFSTSSIEVVTTEVVSATEAIVTVNVAAEVPNGVYDVFLITDDETAALLKGFTVLAAEPVVVDTPTPSPTPVTTPSTPPTTPVAPQPDVTPDPTPASVFFSYSGASINNGNDLFITVAESDATITLYAERTGTQAVDATLIVSGDAVQGEDYQLPNELNLQWAAEVNEPLPIQLTLLDDYATETTEQITLQLTVPAGAELASPSAVHITIAANDAPALADTSDPSPTKPDDSGAISKPTEGQQMPVNTPTQPEPQVTTCTATPMTFANFTPHLVVGERIALQWQGEVTQLPLSNAFVELDLATLMTAAGLNTIEIIGLTAGQTRLTFSNCQGDVEIVITVIEAEQTVAEEVPAEAPAQSEQEPTEPVTSETSLPYYCTLEGHTTGVCASPVAPHVLENNAFATNQQGEAVNVNTTFIINSQVERVDVPFLTERDSLDIQGVIKVDDAHYGRAALLFVILRHEPTGRQWTYAQNWHEWNADPSLLRYQTRVHSLPHLLPVDLSLPLIDVLGADLAGDYTWDIGYQLVSDGTLVFNNPWAFLNRFRVANSLVWHSQPQLDRSNTTANAHFGLQINGQPVSGPTLAVSAEPIEIVAIVKPDSAHIGQTADFFVVATYVSTETAGAYQRLSNGVWQVWDGRPARLLMERQDLSREAVLRTALEVPIFTGDLPLGAGELVIYVGYSLQSASGTMIYNHPAALSIRLK